MSPTNRVDPCLVFLDMEMTGLDPEACAILEIAVVITGADLVPIESEAWVVWQPEEVLQRTEPYVREMHTQNGLLAKVRASETSLATAEREVFALVARHADLGEGLLAGNSIHQDRRFLVRYMPLVERYLSYRQIDVSSLKALTRAWYPSAATFPKPPSDHTALADVLSSLEELRYYKANFFRESLP